jgi:phosphomannomutase
MKKPIISVSGLRGIIGESLSPELAMRFATSFARQAPAGAIVLTRDGRATGRMLADAIRAALMAVGRDVVDADVAATPTTGVLVRQHNAAGGIQISASHNPPEYNGIKLFDGSGRVLPAGVGDKVIRQFESGEEFWVPHQEVGSVVTCDETCAEHLCLVLATVDVERIRQARFRVLLDSNHGAGSLLGMQLLRELKCEVKLLGDPPNGRFAHPPEPTEDNLRDVCSQVTGFGAQIGFCQDPDADRLAIIDDQGCYIGEEYTVALCLERALAMQSGTVVTNCATSRMCSDIADRHNSQLIRSSVGEANVVDEMLAHGAVFGGEGNGGPIDPGVGFVRDSFVGMAQVLDLMASRSQSVSQLVTSLPRYEIHKTKTTLEREKLPVVFDALAKHFSGAEFNRQDGLRLDWSDRWLLVRGSNTEPIVRLIAEAPSRDVAVDLCDAAATVIAGIE